MRHQFYMDFPNLPIESLHQKKHANLSYQLPTKWNVHMFNSKFIECLNIVAQFVHFSTVSVELTSSHDYATIFSRYFAKKYGSFNIEPYYPNSEKIELSELTPYHSWEIVDDAKDLHLQQAGVIADQGLSFHLYPQLYSAKIFEKVTPKNSSFEFYIEDDLYYFSLTRKKGSYWFTPKSDLEAANLPFSVSIWFTQNKFELDISLNWNVLAIEGTPSNLALKEGLKTFLQKGWTFDKGSDIQATFKDASKAVTNLDIDGFIQIEPMNEKVI